MTRRMLLAVMWMGAMGCASAPYAGRGAGDAEYRVYAAVLRTLAESRPGMVVVDRTIPLPCPTGACLGETAGEAWPDAWADYVRNNQSAAPIRADRFPAGFRVRLSGQVPAEPPVDCAAPGWIALSRAGFSGDSTLAMVHWFRDVGVGPTRGCRQPYGVLTILRRQPDGGWEVIAPLPPHPSGILPRP